MISTIQAPHECCNMLGICDLFFSEATSVWNAVMDLGGDVGVNILSDVIFIALVTTLSICWYKGSKGRMLRRFWGLRPNQALKICLSDPRWHPTSNTPDGIDRHQLGMGLVLPLMEYRAAYRIAELFKFLIPGTSDLPEAFRKVFFSEYDVQITPASLDSSWENSSTFVAIGSGAFNSASREFEKRTNHTLSFEVEQHGAGNDSEKNITGIKTPWNEFIQREEKCEMFAIVAKASFGNSTAFYCAGFNEIGSSGAAYFLAKYWENLTDQFGSADFIILLNFWGIRDFNSDPLIIHKSQWNWR